VLLLDMPMSGLNTLCGWLRRLLFCCTARHGPSRKPRDPGRGASSLMLPVAGEKLIASAGWRPSRCLNTSAMHPRAKWERGGHPLVQECTASHYRYSTSYTVEAPARFTTRHDSRRYCA
jgi:hypothetical protein